MGAAPGATTPLYRVYNQTRQQLLADAVELAGHGGARRKGLLGRDGLPPGTGLWIVPCEAIHTFGMRFPIDVLFLDRKQRIRKIRPAMLRNRIAACLSAHSVLELSCGVLGNGFAIVGDQLTIERLNLSA